MVKIRLKRMGAHKKPFYRIVVADSRTSRNGKFIEEIGYYDPIKEPPVIKVDGERATYWLGQGAQATDVVRGLLKKSGVIDKDYGTPGKKFTFKEVAKEETEAEAPASVEAPAEEVVEAAEEAVEVAEEAAESAE